MTLPTKGRRREPGTARAQLTDRVLALHRQLERQSDLEPGERTNRIFAELVDACAHHLTKDAAAVLADPRVEALAPRLREMCADGEYRLERSWARRIVAAADAEAELGAFPYLDNYTRLSTLELATLTGLRPGPSRRVCVLGSGPLPLTALLTARALGVAVDAVDVDEEATLLAAAVLPRLPGGRSVRTHRADARDFPGTADADVVVLAALVGLDPVDKLAVIRAVAHRMRPGALLLVRSAHRLRTLLYPPLSPDHLAAAGGGRLRPLAEIHPFHDVVNSLVIAIRT